MRKHLLLRRPRELARPALLGSVGLMSSKQDEPLLRLKKSIHFAGCNVKTRRDGDAQTIAMRTLPPVSRGCVSQTVGIVVI